ncbi:hypothetical protein B2J93_3779 [Marssonina coronariae]|uniref:Uncharacterized protein n=1 Tax=Diplocarpon coronariae TaxID=2795749 RepID=A0A218YY34_9HELO|nr:hypothetical protein B2J93_3779 [Marssonina coronariae]
MAKEAVYTPKAPEPLPFFSQAIKSGGMVYCSGSIGVDPATKALVEGGVEARTDADLLHSDLELIARQREWEADGEENKKEQALQNLSEVLLAAGSSIDNVVKVNIFLTDMKDFVAMNAVYERVFHAAPKPVRTCVAVHQLPLGTDVEIELTAHQIKARGKKSKRTASCRPIASEAQLLPVFVGGDPELATPAADTAPPPPSSQIPVSTTRPMKGIRQPRAASGPVSTTPLVPSPAPRRCSFGSAPADFRQAPDGPPQYQSSIMREKIEVSGRRHTSRGPSMSEKTRTRARAQEALNELEPVHGDFGPEDQRALQRNLARMTAVAADTVEDIVRAGQAARERQRRSEGLLRATTAEDRYQAPEEIVVGDHGRREDPRDGKRSRSDDDDDDDDAPAAKRARYPTPAVQIQEPVDIARLAPIALQINYEPHPTADRGDDWWCENFRRLYHQLDIVVTHYFALHDISQVEGSPWTLGMTPEFVRWAEQVADPEWESSTRTGGWDELLKDSRLRKWFLMAILMKIFKTKIFDEYLFGASKEQKEACFALDRAFLTREGFQRTSVRATTVRAVLGLGAVTESFYPCVAKLSAQICLMLQPLTTYLYSLPPLGDAPLPRVADLHQSLHNLVSQAAYLSLCVRVSPTIFQFVDLQPAADWDPEDMHSLETDAYTVGKATIAAAYHREKFVPWVQKRSLAAKSVDELQAVEPPPTQAQLSAHAHAVRRRDADNWQAIAEGRPQNEDPILIPGSQAMARARRALAEIEAARPPAPSFTHRAQSKISVWPVIRRYKPGSDAEDAEPLKPLGEKDGFRIKLVAKGAIVAKYGRKVEENRIELDDWIAVVTAAGQPWISTKAGLGAAVAAASVAATATARFCFGVDVSASLADVFYFGVGKAMEVVAG